ncbi:MAG TPA: PepSY-associated TM helix domain-containing protein [Nitrospiraceae bacterium]|nr:PepSY-associated TM helix domain-containing protein [Nitrospiraceae bacterium]
MMIATLKGWYFIHKWSSLVCTVFLLLLCLTGLPLIFRDELAVWLGDAVEPPEHVTATEVVTLDALIKDAQSRRPHDHVRFLTLDDDSPAWFVSLGKTLTAQDNSALFMYDARTGAFLHDPPTNEGLMNLLFKLHVELLAGLPGTLFLGAMGVIFLASVVSGIVVYGPFMRKLPFGTIRQDGSFRRTWLDLHNLLGIVTVLWVLVVGATGVVNTLDRPLLAYWQMTEIADMITPWKDKSVPAMMKPVDDVVKTAQAAAPDMIVRFIAFPGTLFAGPHHYMVFMRGQTPLTERLLKPLLVDAATAQVSDARNLPWYLTVLLLSQPLHFGDYGGMPLKVVWAVLDVVTILVLVSGLYLWSKKRNMSVEQLLIQTESDREMVPSSPQGTVLP